MLGKLILISFLAIGCTPLKQWQTEYPDNVIEESIEDYIEEILKRNIDLSPFTGNEYHKFDITNK